MKIKFTKPLAYMMLICSTLSAQTGKKANKLSPILAEDPKNQSHIRNRGCASIVPDDQWESQFQQLIAQHKLDMANNKVSANYTIPVVIHIISNSTVAIGTYPNISDAQAISQIAALNNDYAGIGLNTGNYPSTAFTAYATAAALPAANKDANGRPKISNFNINFCLATIDKNGATMPVAGIDRVSTSSFTLSAGYTSKDPANIVYGDNTNSGNPTNFQNFINNIVKPQTIWDPTKYMNIWVTDEYAGTAANQYLDGPGLLGFGTFPAGSTLTGVSGFGTATTDGLWCWSRAFGTTGTLDPTYNKGRTATHEIGHWLGLRHVWGDGTCATDYCLDTPPATAANYTLTTYPAKANSCTAPTGVSNTTPNGANGEMFMNFMDYSNDIYMYMFTEDQRTRAQTAMANGTYRKLLGTHGLCSVGAATPAVAAFSMTNTACKGSAVSVTNNSTGNPTPTYTWSASPSTGVTFSPNANSTTPSITFTNNGSYVISLSAQSGTTAVNTKTNSITISTCTAPAVCSLTVSNVAATDTMYVGSASSDTATPGCSPKAGYVFGSNCYQDKEKASFFASSSYSVVSPAPAMVTGAVVVYYKNGTKGTGGAAATTANLKMYNGTLAGGPTGAAIATSTANLGQITAATATNNIGYLAGDASVTYNTSLAIPYKYTFATPIAAPAAGFYLSVAVPITAGDTAVVLNDLHATTNTSWEMYNDNTWHNMNASWLVTNNMAIFPIVTCTTKLTEYNSLANNVIIMPNPSNGLFNLLMTLPTVQDLTVTVTNTLGQTVYLNNYKSFTNGMVSVDLSDKNQGIYFVTISNGTEKNVQRIVVTK